MNTKKLVAFLSSGLTSKSMASAFINEIESEKQTAGVKSTLANAFKKISSQKIFMVLSADEVPLNINSKEKSCGNFNSKQPKVRIGIFADYSNDNACGYQTDEY